MVTHTRRYQPNISPLEEVIANERATPQPRLSVLPSRLRTEPAYTIHTVPKAIWRLMQYLIVVPLEHRDGDLHAKKPIPANFENGLSYKEFVKAINTLRCRGFAILPKGFTVLDNDFGRSVEECLEFITKNPPHGSAMSSTGRFHYLYRGNLDKDSKYAIPDYGMQGEVRTGRIIVRIIDPQMYLDFFENPDRGVDINEIQGLVINPSEEVIKAAGMEYRRGSVPMPQDYTPEERSNGGKKSAYLRRIASAKLYSKAICAIECKGMSYREAGRYAGLSKSQTYSVHTRYRAGELDTHPDGMKTWWHHKDCEKFQRSPENLAKCGRSPGIIRGTAGVHRAWGAVEDNSKRGDIVHRTPKPHPRVHRRACGLISRIGNRVFDHTDRFHPSSYGNGRLVRHLYDRNQRVIPHESKPRVAIVVYAPSESRAWMHIKDPYVRHVLGTERIDTIGSVPDISDWIQRESERLMKLSRTDRMTRAQALHQPEAPLTESAMINRTTALVKGR